MVTANVWVRGVRRWLREVENDWLRIVEEREERCVRLGCIAGLGRMTSVRKNEEQRWKKLVKYYEKSGLGKRKFHSWICCKEPRHELPRIRVHRIYEKPLFVCYDALYHWELETLEIICIHGCGPLWPGLTAFHLPWVNKFEAWSVLYYPMKNKLRSS